MSILVITTGGTIDSEAYPESGQPEYTIPSSTCRSIEMLRDLAGDEVPPIEVDWIEFCNKDSKDFNADDLDALYDAVIQNGPNCQRIIITIGTDRMTAIAKDLRDRFTAEPPCQIVFTGAIWPLANGSRSEGRANLRLALLKNPTAAPGVYVAMHGLFEPCDKIRKDAVLKKFELITG